MNIQDYDDPQPIKVKEPKDLPPVNLTDKPTRVTVPPKTEIHVDVTWLELLYGIWRKGSEHDLNELNKGNEGIFWPTLLQLLSRDWWKVALTIVAIGVAITAIIIFAK